MLLLPVSFSICCFVIVSTIFGVSSIRCRYMFLYVGCASFLSLYLLSSSFLFLSLFSLHSLVWSFMLSAPYFCALHIGHWCNACVFALCSTRSVFASKLHLQPEFTHLCLNLFGPYSPFVTLF